MNYEEIFKTAFGDNFNAKKKEDTNMTYRGYFERAYNAYYSNHNYASLSEKAAAARRLLNSVTEAYFYCTYSVIDTSCKTFKEKYKNSYRYLNTLNYHVSKSLPSIIDAMQIGLDDYHLDTLNNLRYELDEFMTKLQKDITVFYHNDEGISDFVRALDELLYIVGGK